MYATNKLWFDLKNKAIICTLLHVDQHFIYESTKWERLKTFCQEKEQGIENDNMSVQPNYYTYTEQNYKYNTQPVQRFYSSYKENSQFK